MSKKILSGIIALSSVAIISAPGTNTLAHGFNNNKMETASGAPKDYKYVSVEGDPMAARIYTLENGLKIYLSVNNVEPRIQTYIAVRAGSKFDPAEVTGLAHYLEHML